MRDSPYSIEAQLMLLLALVLIVVVLGIAAYAVLHRWWLIAVLCVATAFDVAVLWWDGYKMQAKSQSTLESAKGAAAP